MSMEIVFPFLREEREREIKKELDLLRRLLTVMERDERKVSGEPAEQVVIRDNWKKRRGKR